jgi:hypothetical protein
MIQWLGLVAVTALGVATLWQNRRLKEIHVLVNSRLSDLLDKVQESRHSGNPVPPIKRNED